MTPRIELAGAPEMGAGKAGPGRLEIDINGEVVLVGTPESLDAVGAQITAQVAAYRARWENVNP